jgi:hypothetical protein
MHAFILMAPIVPSIYGIITLICLITKSSGFPDKQNNIHGTIGQAKVSIYTFQGTN